MGKISQIISLKYLIDAVSRVEVVVRGHTRSNVSNICGFLVSLHVVKHSKFIVVSVSIELCCYCVSETVHDAVEVPTPP